MFQTQTGSTGHLALFAMFLSFLNFSFQTQTGSTGHLAELVLAEEAEDEGFKPKRAPQAI